MRFDVDEARDEAREPIAGIALAIVLTTAESPRTRAGPYAAAADKESLPVWLLLLRLRLAVSDCDGFVVGGDQPRPAMFAIVKLKLQVASCKVECGNTLKLRNSSVVSFMMRRKCGLKNQVSKL